MFLYLVSFLWKLIGLDPWVYEQCRTTASFVNALNKTKISLG